MLTAWTWSRLRSIGSEALRTKFASRLTERSWRSRTQFAQLHLSLAQFRLVTKAVATMQRPRWMSIACRLGICPQPSSIEDAHLDPHRLRRDAGDLRDLARGSGLHVGDRAAGLPRRIGGGQRRAAVERAAGDGGMLLAEAAADAGRAVAAR